MSSFSSDMRVTVLELCQELGNSCVVSKPSATAVYNPTTGESTGGAGVSFNTYSAQYDKFFVSFGSDGTNTNLSGLMSERVIIPWFGHMVDTTWLYNGHNITDVSFIESDDDILYFTLSVGEKS